MPGGDNQFSHKVPADFIHPGLPSKCTWQLNKKEKTPHTVRPFTDRPKILPNILHAIGSSPLVKLNHIPQVEGIKCEMYAKCEFLNPGGSVKDRIGYRMVEDAESKGILTPGCTIIEPTSGNTGIGIAMACAVKGYKCLIVMPDKMSNEKVDALRVLGAKIIRTPIEAAFDSPEGLIAVAQRLQKEIPNSVLLDQYRNSGNPLAHYDGTGAEILWQLDNKVDMIVIGAGTGGTVCGIGRKIKEENPKCIIVGVDPDGSILAQPEKLNETNVSFYEVEGIGYDFIPTVLDRSVVDIWIKIQDKDCFPMARRLNCEEGLLCGGSSGGAMYAALKAAKQLKEGQRCVVILPDGIRNYMTKFVSDNWMEARDFKESVNEHQHWWWDHKVSELSLPLPKIINSSMLCQDVLKIMKENNLDVIPVVDNGAILGGVTLSNLLSQFVSLNLKQTDPVRKAIYKKTIKITPETHLGKVGRILEVEKFVLVIATEKISGDSVVTGVINHKDFINFISK